MLLEAQANRDHQAGDALPRTRPMVGLLLVVILLTGLIVLVTSDDVRGESTCESIGEREIEICDEFLDFWHLHGGHATFGEPLTSRFEEISSNSLDEREVQYFEHARLERHPAHDGTDYAVQLGRIGAELLAAGGMDWDSLPKVDPGSEHFMEVTGQAIDPDFWGFWSGNGLQFADDGVSFRESLGLFGYPLTPAETSVDENGDEVRVQWFERARLEIDPTGEVTVAPLGSLMDDDANGLSIRLQREIGATIEAIFAAHDSPGLGVWISSPELGDWQWAAGYADPDSGAPYREDTRHRIGSVTKPLIASVVLQLVDEGLLSLDETVDRWFPELEAADQVTVRMLGNMTSGIFNYTDALAWQSAASGDRQQVWDPLDLVEYGFGLSGAISPGAEWQYSNTNYVMLGLIIEDVTGNELRVEIQDRFLDPLGLDGTNFPAPNDSRLSEPLARGITRNALTSEEADATEWNPSWAYAAGQMVSTAEDLLTWLPQLYESELLALETQEERLGFVEIVDGNADVGYGFGVLLDQGWLGHDGLLPGYGTTAFYRPDIATSLVVFTNSDIRAESGRVAAGDAHYRITRILNREYQTPSVD